MVEREQGYDRSIVVEPRLTCANLSQLKRRHFMLFGGAESRPARVNSTNLGIIIEGRGYRETPPGPVGLQAEPPTTARSHSISFRPF